MHHNQGLSGNSLIFGCGQISRQSNFPVVIPSLRSRTSLSGTQWSEESLILF